MLLGDSYAEEGQPAKPPRGPEILDPFGPFSGAELSRFGSLLVCFLFGFPASGFLLLRCRWV